ncbi:MAG: endonuclease/exonuclease/phosphatase family protein [Patescibacteria group bacterium]|jgi:endonuclease/exonuclease/phosphatase family metal-dependent hydrolase
MSETLNNTERQGFWRILSKRSTAFILMIGLLTGAGEDVDYADEVKRVHPTSSELDGDALQVMTANVHGWRGTDGNDNLSDLLRVMDEYEVDVACLQEVNVARGHLSKLYDAGYNVLYAETERDGYGNAVVGTPNMALKRNYSLPPRKNIKQRGALLAEIYTRKGEVEVLATHVTTSRYYQKAQFGKLGQIAKVGFADVVCGDLNRDLEIIAKTTLGEYFSKSLEARFNQGNTFPANQPEHRIDFVLSTCQEFGQPTLVDINSDHLGVIHKFGLADCE